jgi:ferredoxin
VKRILLIGTGPSGWAVLNSMSNLDNVWVIDGDAQIDFKKVASSKHLGLKRKFGSSHSFGRVKDSEILDVSNYALPLSYSRGGFGEVWGRGFTPYDITEYGKNNCFEKLDLYPAMKRILSKIPYLHSPSDLDLRFGAENLWGQPGISSKLDLHPFFSEILQKGKRKDTDNSILVGTPNQFVDNAKCTRCTLCLTGCPYGALFDPGDEVNKMIFSGKLRRQNILKGKVIRISRSENVNIVEYISNGQISKIEFDEVIISAGPLSTLLILIKSKLLPHTFQLPDSQVFYAALFSVKRVQVSTNTPELGQILVYPREGKDFDFQLSLYAPSKTSQMRISETIFKGKLSRLKIPRFFTDHLIPVIGFLPQEASGFLQVSQDGDSVTVNRENNKTSRQFAQFSFAKAKKAFLNMGLHFVPFSLRLPDVGAGFHLGASLPLGGEFIDRSGYLKSNRTIRIMDASLLPKIPAGGHTFLAMALIDSLMRDQTCES